MLIVKINYVILQTFLYKEVNKNVGSSQEMLMCRRPWKEFGYYTNSNRMPFKVIVRERCPSFHFKNVILDFLGGAVIKNPPANAGDTGLILAPGRSHTWRATKPVSHNY